MDLTPLLSPAGALKRQTSRVEMNKGKKVMSEPELIPINQNKSVDPTESVALVTEKTEEATTSRRAFERSCALQSQLFLRKDVKFLSKKVSTLTSSNSKLKKKVKKAKYDLERLTKESAEKLAKTEVANARLRAVMVASEKKLSDIDDMLADVLEKLDKAADEVVIQIRGELMHQYLHGETNSWRPEEDIEVWESWKKLNELEQVDE
ncbi:hypothetical protein Ddye_024397 [Dipteronia dyeriana]|uniref:Uncharacterized protein n=1 Tax=Dipteronia dyeriana TaxID=168575 RepID=A0AAD9TVP5_9ROSI|nr:hypothetical protein Ddye_024397 [Dipteronia dyeriana]